MFRLTYRCLIRGNSSSLTFVLIDILLGFVGVILFESTSLFYPSNPRPFGVFSFEATGHDFTDPVLSDPLTSPSIVGVGYQYGGQKTILATHKTYPDKLIMQTETECHHGKNFWSEGMYTYDSFIEDTKNFANGYMFWNMILSKDEPSTWGWKQNSLITIDSQSQKVIYNPEFYSMKHFSNLVLPGAIRIGASDRPFPKLTAFQNPSDSIVVCFTNESKVNTKAVFKIGETMVPVDAPPDSMNSVVVSP